MHVMIIGSGRVGATIAKSLLQHGHHVSVVDSDPDSLMRLGGDEFPGDFFVGDALDPSVLDRAGIERADAFVASTDNDNANVVVAQIARKRYQVANVVARVFDPDKASFYEGRGIRVVCPTNRAIDEMIAVLDPVSGRFES